MDNVMTVSNSVANDKESVCVRERKRRAGVCVWGGKIPCTSLQNVIDENELAALKIDGSEKQQHNMKLMKHSLSLSHSLK